MQIKLVINDTFPEYYFGDDKTYEEEPKDVNLIEIDKSNWTDETPKVINIFISDTYYIEADIIPHCYLNTPTLHFIRKNNNNNTNRVYSPILIEQLNNELNKINGPYTINLFATTNPKNLYYITKNIFQKADRSNIQQIKVFPQSKGTDNNWKFDDKPKDIIK